LFPVSVPDVLLHSITISWAIALGADKATSQGGSSRQPPLFHFDRVALDGVAEKESLRSIPRLPPPLRPIDQTQSPRNAAPLHIEDRFLVLAVGAAVCSVIEVSAIQPTSGNHCLCLLSTGSNMICLQSKSKHC
jgi:hypothetical protein